MTMRDLPKADVSARPGASSGLQPKALDRWNPDLRAADGAAEDDASISILDVIGEDWWTGQGVTSKRIAAALRAIGNRDVTVNINSPGGDYFEGLAIYELLRMHPARVTVRIMGLAASAASIIAMAGDEVLIGRSGFLMIHNVWVVAGGDKAALREVADWLEPFDQAAVDIYAARTGLDAKDLARMLDKETWINGTAAVDQGFADDFLDPAAVDGSTKASSGKDTVVWHKMDAMLARAGVSRKERREMFAAAKGGMPGAALSGMQDAAVVAEVEGLLNRIRAL